MVFKKVKKKQGEGEAKAVREKRSFYDPSRGIHRLLPCLFLTAAVLLGVFLFLDSSGSNDSALGKWLVKVLRGLFSHAVYALPVLLLIQGIRWRVDVERRRAISRIVYYTLFLILAESVVWCFMGPKEPFSASLFFTSGEMLTGAGFFGGAVGYFLNFLTGYIGVPLLTVATVGMFFYHFLELTPHALMERRQARRAAMAETRAQAARQDLPGDVPPSAEETDAATEEEREPAAPASPQAPKILTPEEKNELARLHRSEQTGEDEKPMTRKEKKALKRAKKSHSQPAYDGYYPQEDDESFEEIRRRLEREAIEIERERMNAAAKQEPPAAPASVAAPSTASDMSDGYRDTAPTVRGIPFDTFAADSTETPRRSDGAQSADVAFGSFNPLAADAVINTASTVLRPAGNGAGGCEVRRETLHPVRPTQQSEPEEYRRVPGGIKGKGDGIGSFCIHAAHMDIPSTRNPRPAATQTAGVQTVGMQTVAAETAYAEQAEEVESTSVPTEEETVTRGTPLSDFELITKRTDNEIQQASPLPYVHPATHPATQPQPEQVPPMGYPYPGMPYGQPVYPPATAYPQGGYPAQPYMPYPTSPYPPYPYPPVQGQPVPPTATAPGATPAPAADTAAMATPDTAPDAFTVRITQHTDVQKEEAMEATSHVVEHNLQAQTPSPVSQETPKKEEPKRQAPSYDRYLFPPLSLLSRSVPITNANSQAEIDDTSARLVNEFRKFKYNVEVREVTVGPRITRYSISPPDGVRINTLVNLANDIALGLAVKSIRIDPVPNTPYLGVEIPNRTPTTVRLSSLIDTESYRNTKTVTTIPVGASVTGQPVFADIAKMPHVLIAGATGMGKSVFMNSLLLSLLYKAKPNEVKLILVDPKRVELSIYNGIPHLLIPPVVEPQKAAGALIWAVGEMERRYHLMETVGMRSIEGYNQVVRKDPSKGEPQPKIIIVIDELNDLMMQARDAVEPAIMSIAQKARAAGIHLILGTQRPSVDVITGVIKANIPSRIAFHVSSGTDSRTILDFYGAEKLLNNGDMLASIAGAEAIRVQGAFVSDEEVENVTSFLKQNAGPAVYDEIINAQIESETEKYKNSGKRQSERDESDEEMDGSIFEDSKFMEACQVALESGKISTSLLQRRCSIGYGKAAKYIDIMQSMGIVSAPDGQKPREVLMSRDQFMEMVSRESYTGD